MTKKIILILIVVFFSAVALRVLAANVHNLDFSIPCPKTANGDCPSPTGENALPNYIKTLYQFSLGVAGVLAAGMIAAGAIYRAISAGSPDKINEANDMITSALLGLVLLFGSFLILRTVNPVLVELRSPEAKTTEKFVFQGFRGIKNVECWSEEKDLIGTSTQVDCFINPQKNLSDPKYVCKINDPDSVCEAIANTSPICQKDAASKRPGEINCVCPDCKPLLYFVYNTPLDQSIQGTKINFPIKSGNTCKDNADFGCFLNKNTLDKLEKALGNMFLLGINISAKSSDSWRITEAFPPYAEHKNRCHYQGTCLDFAKIPPDLTTSSPGVYVHKNEIEKFCDEYQKVINAFASAGFGGLLEKADEIHAACQAVKKPITVPAGFKLHSTSTAFHLHVY
jgi:hypothetical protein